ncbi:uncharacterized protein J4E78_005854 [Alternaria triticimaculans]|uniref:uncharacterized protein n=1 Tax=Alternaria triticimaculans TaxID=297637 RepID=UPI0020C555BB|nr:uncharacterized protein J4E78_005854 [Alternaria triticimaculans]KAI4659426.1 hypothetical protein J4E78_005854 [Alternaria triticimaculans]
MESPSNPHKRQKLGFESYSNSRVLSDITIRYGVSGERTFEAHKVVLSAMSYWFKAAFTGQFAESSAREITLKEDDPDALLLMLNFAYDQKIPSLDDVDNVVRTARSIRDCLGLYRVADKYDFPQFLDRLGTVCDLPYLEHTPSRNHASPLQTAAAQLTRLVTALALYVETTHPPYLPTMPETTKVVPLTCHGHSRPVPHIHFSSLVDEDQYYIISACKDNNPMLRDGVTGDWIGTFLGHKGAVWQARLSSDASLAATASADFSAKVWDTHTGEALHTLSHNHIVRAVAFPNQPHPQILATGGMEKKLRIYDLSRSDATSFEIGAGVHTGTIKSIVWTSDPNVIITAAEDKKVRWWDLRQESTIGEHAVEGTVGSCELDNTSSEGILSVAAGNSAYFFNSQSPGSLIKSIKTPYEIASVALHNGERKFVTGGSNQNDTWVRVWDFNEEKELETNKGHHGPIWSASFSPDGKLYATGSEDGTVKLWKFTSGPYGLWK